MADSVEPSLSQLQTASDAMRLALDEAQTALATGDVPVGAVVLDADGVVIGITRKIKHWDKNAALEKLMKHLGEYEADNNRLVAARVSPTVRAVAANSANV
jgi:tRNA(adenine34) deaminase